MIYFQEQEHDFTETTYIGINQSYRWWVSINNDRNCVTGLQVCRLVTIDGVRKVGRHVYSNMPESETVNSLDQRLISKIESLSLSHHAQNGRKGDFREYKKPFRSQGRGSPLAQVIDSGGSYGSSMEDSGMRRPKGMYERDSIYSPDLELGCKADAFEGNFQSQPRSQRGINRFC